MPTYAQTTRDRQRERDMTKLVVTFCNSANAPKNYTLRNKIKIKPYVELQSVCLNF